MSVEERLRQIFSTQAEMVREGDNAWAKILGRLDEKARRAGMPAGSAASKPDVRPGRPRVATVLMAAALSGLTFIAGIALASQRSGALQPAEPGQDTYLLSGFEVIYPYVDPDVPGSKAETDQAGVTFDARWSGTTFPGSAQCETTLTDASGSTVGSLRFQFMSTPPATQQASPLPVDVKGAPTAASGFCAAGVTPQVSLTYSFTDLSVAATAAGTTMGPGPVLEATAHWPGPPSDGIVQVCRAEIIMSDGTIDAYAFTLSVPDGAALKLRLPARFAGATDPTISCAPYARANDVLTASTSFPGSDRHRTARRLNRSSWSRHLSS